MDVPCRIRPATPADGSALARLERVAFADPWSAASLRDLLTSSSAFGFVAEDAGEVVGYGLGRTVVDEGEVLNLAVAPTHRRRGIARALLAQVLDRFDTHPVLEVFLEVRESNLPALQLYRRHGFVPVGRREGYYHHPVEAGLVLRRGRTPPA